MVKLGFVRLFVQKVLCGLKLDIMANLIRYLSLSVMWSIVKLGTPKNLLSKSRISMFIVSIILVTARSPAS